MGLIALAARGGAGWLPIESPCSGTKPPPRRFRVADLKRPRSFACAINIEMDPTPTVNLTVGFDFAVKETWSLVRVGQVELRFVADAFNFYPSI